MVKNVFKTLLKVPCYIAIGYLIMNIVLFLGYYMKALGLSYAVMQIAVENNYIPDSERDILTNTMESLGSRVIYNSDGTIATTEDGNPALQLSSVSDFGVYIDTNGVKTSEALYSSLYSVSSNNLFDGTNGRITSSSVNQRKQYGNNITVGVGYIYHPVLPLPSGSNSNANAFSNDVNASANIMEYKNATVDSSGNALGIPITITYKVPGLKYYPDLN